MKTKITKPYLLLPVDKTKPEEMVWKGDRDSQLYPFHPYIHFTPQTGF